MGVRGITSLVFPRYPRQFCLLLAKNRELPTKVIAAGFLVQMCYLRLEPSEVVGTTTGKVTRGSHYSVVLFLQKRLKMLFLPLVYCSFSKGWNDHTHVSFIIFFPPADFSNVPDITTGLKRSQTDGTLDQVPHREKTEQTFRVRCWLTRSQARSQAGKG